MCPASGKFSQQKVDFDWYGWIPILTGELLFDYYCFFNLARVATKLAGKEKKIIDKILSKDGLYYRWYKETDDILKNKAKVVISLESRDKIDNVLIFDKGQILRVHASCKIERDGIVRIQLLVPLDKIYEKEIIQQVYIIIRDVYHSHTHHDRHEDLLLHPIKSYNQENAINEILKQYSVKIIEYHKRIRRSIEIAEKISQTAKLITRASGEITYALSFINLFKRGTDEYQSLQSIFSNACNSIKVLSREIELNYSSKINEKITRNADQTKNLTIFILIFTIVLVILTIVLLLK
jgi:hypothetical protein